MTVYRPKIVGGPAGDVMLARWAELIRLGYALGNLDDLAGDGTDEAKLELFGAFLAGRGAPPIIGLDPPPADDEELIYVFVCPDRTTARLEARRRRLGDTWRWRHVANAADVERELRGFDRTDLVIVELEPVGQGTLDDALAAYRPIEDVDAGGRL